MTWLAFFDHLLKRGLDPGQVKLLVSDGSKGLLATMTQCLPNACQQRCITHKVRGMKPYLTYHQLPQNNESSEPLSQAQAKKLRWQQLKYEAYTIYEAHSYAQAQQLLQAFVEKWQPVEPKAVHAFSVSSAIKLMNLAPFLMKPVVSLFSFSLGNAITLNTIFSLWRNTNDTNEFVTFLVPDLPGYDFRV